MPTLARLVLVALLGVPLAAQETPSARLVAIGDVHGHIEGLSTILVKAGLTDAGGRWTGGKASLIQTGDFMDRDDNVRAVMDRLMTIETEAKAAGGMALALLGNHEVMNLIGLTRDATPAIFATFADAQSASRREKEWDRYSLMAEARHDVGEAPAPVYQQTREQWMTAHPLGYIEYREALGPKGKYGRWLRGKPMVIKVGDSIFMHAGIDAAQAPKAIDELNDKLKSEISRIDKFMARLVERKITLPSFTLQEALAATAAEIDTVNGLIKAANAGRQPLDPDRVDFAFVSEAIEMLKMDEWNVLATEGPLWYRGLALLPDEPAGGPVAPLLDRYGARRFVVGHTPTEDRRIHSRFGGRVVVIDTGMSPTYEGRPSALEIDGDRLMAIYEDGRIPVGVAASTGAPAEARNHATVWRSPSSSVTLGR